MVALHVGQSHSLGPNWERGTFRTPPPPIPSPGANQQTSLRLALIGEKAASQHPRGKDPTCTNGRKSPNIQLAGKTSKACPVHHQEEQHQRHWEAQAPPAPTGGKAVLKGTDTMCTNRRKDQHLYL